MQTMVPLYGFGGGSGGTGATLTVTAPSGCTVTVTKDGKTKTKVADSSGLAVFKGLASGEWTISITDGEQTAQKTVTITADYSTAITFFAATIHITYPAGSTCTATDGVTTLTAPDTSGTWECVVPNAGTWTIKAPHSNGDFSENVAISATGETKSVSLKLYLFNSGTYKNISSFVSKAAKPSGYTLTAKAPTISGTSTLKLVLGADYDGTVFSNTTVNFNNVNTLKMNITGISVPLNANGDSVAVGFGVTKTNSDGYTRLATKWLNNGQSTGTISVNVSSISESAYLFILLTGWGEEKSVSFNKIWLEP